MSEGVRCETCGTLVRKSPSAKKRSLSSITPTLSDGVDEVDEGPDVAPAAPPARKRPHQERIRYDSLRHAEKRVVVRARMLCQIPGFDRVQAKAVVEKYPTFIELMAASEDDLATIRIDESTLLGVVLAKALKWVLQ